MYFYNRTKVKKIKMKGWDIRFPQLRLTTTLAAADEETAKAAAKAAAKAKPKAAASPPTVSFISLAEDQDEHAAPVPSVIPSRASGAPAGAGSGADTARAITAGEAREAAQRLADALGLSLGALTEDPSGDPAFTDGLLEVVGADAAKVLRDVRIALEEDEENDADELDDEFGVPTSAASSSAGGGAAIVPAPAEAASSASTSGLGSDMTTAPALGVLGSAASSSGPSLVAPASDIALLPTGLEGRRKVVMHGLDVEYTGFTAGLIMRICTPADGKEIGLIHRVNKVSLTATCKVPGHKNCSCWITRRDRPQSELEDELVAWYVPAILGFTAEEHFDLASDLKRPWGMAPLAKRKAK